MSLPASLRSSLTAHEVEFIAGEELIDIQPNIRMDPIRLISGVYGPFRPPARVRVPLWVATNLKLKKKCHIVPPDWLSVESLQEKLQEELDKNEFSEMPFHYVETSKVLLDVASDDLVDPNQIRSLLKDLREARQSKSRLGLENLREGVQAGYFEMPNISALEIAEIRPFFVKSLSVLRKLNPQAAGDITGTQMTQGDTTMDDYSFSADLSSTMDDSYAIS